MWKKKIAKNVSQSCGVNECDLRLIPLVGDVTGCEPWHCGCRAVMLMTAVCVLDCSDSSGSEGPSPSRKQSRPKRKGSNGSANGSSGRRRKSGISARERNLRRLESNERERMRMHSLNDAFEVGQFYEITWKTPPSPSPYRPQLKYTYLADDFSANFVY